MTLFSWWSHEDAPHDVASDNRVQPRTDAFIELTLCCDDEELPGCHTQNISNKGVYIDLPHALDVAPGTMVDLRFHIWTGRDHIARFLHARVVRCDERGLALHFTDHDLSTHAVVQDILYYQQFERRGERRTMTQRHSFGANFSAWVARLMA
jgi:hypothetical protein